MSMITFRLAREAQERKQGAEVQAQTAPVDPVDQESSGEKSEECPIEPPEPAPEPVATKPAAAKPVQAKASAPAAAKVKATPSVTSAK
jgi:hypothetical protein